MTAQPALDAFQQFRPVGGSLEEISRPLLEALGSALGLESTYLTSVDEGRGVQRVVFTRNAVELEIPEGVDFPWSDTLCRRALEEGQAWVPDVPERWPDSQAARDLGLVTYVSTPIFARDGALMATLCGASAESKPVNAQALVVLNMFATLLGERLEQERQISLLRQQNQELSAQALLDPLTGLPNRRALQAELARELLRAARCDSQVAVAFIDLDGFKAINDTHGHDAGDRFLVGVGQRLAAGLRGGDFAARHGGDEFVVLSPHAAADSAPRIAARLSGLVVGDYDLGTVVLAYPGASIGVVLAAGGREADQVLRDADAAMYEAKRERRAAVKNSQR